MNRFSVTSAGRVRGDCGDKCGESARGDCGDTAGRLRGDCRETAGRLPCFLKLFASSPPNTKIKKNTVCDIFFKKLQKYVKHMFCTGVVSFGTEPPQNAGFPKVLLHRPPNPKINMLIVFEMFVKKYIRMLWALAPDDLREMPSFPKLVLHRSPPPNQRNFSF